MYYRRTAPVAPPIFASPHSAKNPHPSAGPGAYCTAYPGYRLLECVSKTSARSDRWKGDGCHGSLERRHPLPEPRPLAARGIPSREESTVVGGGRQWWPVRRLASLDLLRLRSMARLVALLLSSVHVATAHVAMQYTAGQPGPIRGATSATGNARRHVSGACGLGNPAFGANGEGTLQDGATVTLTQTYAAGHTGNAQKFRMAFACGTTTANALANSGAALTAAANQCTATKAGAAAEYEDTGNIGVNAANGPADNPYTVTCTMPSQALAAGQTQQCTIALVAEGGHGPWGDCVDVNLVSAAAALPPAPPPAPLVLNTGDYGFAASRAIDTSAASFTCCPLSSGSLIVPQYALGASSFNARISNALATGCRDNPSITAPTTSTHDVNGPMLFSLVAGDKYEASMPRGGMMAGQAFTFTIEAGQLLFENTEDTEQPIICDGTSAIGLDSGDGVGQGAGGDGGGSGGVVAVVVILIVIAVLAAAYNHYRKPQSVPPEMAAGKFQGVPPPPPPPPAGFALPPGWSEQLDPASGNPYYHNAATGVTTWTKPTGNVV